MGKKKDEPAVDETVEAVQEPKLAPPLILDDYARGGALVTVTLQGGGNGDGQYRVASPIPQHLAVNGSNYDLSVRATGLYNFRHR